MPVIRLRRWSARAARGALLALAAALLSRSVAAQRIDLLGRAGPAGSTALGAVWSLPGGGASADERADRPRAMCIPGIDSPRRSRGHVAARGLLVGALVGGVVGFVIGRDKVDGAGALMGPLIAAPIGAPIGMVIWLLKEPAREPNLAATR
jgi:hypothetical protein